MEIDASVSKYRNQVIEVILQDMLGNLASLFGAKGWHKE